MGWIITGIVVVPFFVMAIFLLNGKGSFLIAGFNTMDPKDKATYDEKALCKAVGKLMLVLAALALSFPLAMQLDAPWLFWVSFVLFMVVIFGFAIYANTGNRFRVAVDPDAPAGAKEKVPMTRGKKVLLFICIAVSVQVCIGAGVMIYLGERDPVVSVLDGFVKISGLYGTEIRYDRIDEIILVEKSMRDIGIGSRTNGYSTTGLALKGNFSSQEHGQQLLFVYSSSSPTIQIIRKSGADIFISFRESELTVETYNKLASALP